MAIVPQSLAPGQLGEDHAGELLAAAKVADTGLGVAESKQAGSLIHRLHLFT